MNKQAMIVGLIGLGLMAGAARMEAQQPDMAELQQGLAGMMQMMTAGATNAALIDFRELKAALPATLPGMKRTSAKGERNSALGISATQATGEYKNDDGASITIEIQDLGGTGMMGLMAMGFQAEVESESDDGYEKTYTHKNCKVREEYTTSSQSGTMNVLVGQRMVVNISGEGVTAAAMTAALNALDIAKLEALTKPK